MHCDPLNLLCGAITSTYSIRNFGDLYKTTSCQSVYFMERQFLMAFVSKYKSNCGVKETQNEAFFYIIHNLLFSLYNLLVIFV